MNLSLSRSLLRATIIFFLAIGNTAVMARNLSEIALSKEMQEAYLNYQVDVFLQQEGYGDQQLSKHYSDLVMHSEESLKVFIKHSPEYWHKTLEEMLVGSYIDDFSLEMLDEKSIAVRPTIHYKSNFEVNETLVVDYPLIVEGDLIVKGNLLIGNDNAPVLVTGDVYVSNNLLMSDEDSYYYLPGKIEVKGNVFIDGKTTILKQLSAKNVFSLSTSQMLSGSLTPFPNSPLFVRPSILPWNDEVDASVLFAYLKRDVEPFIKPFEKNPKSKSWGYFLNAWEGVTHEPFYHPDIAGLKHTELDINELTDKGKQQISKKSGKFEVQADLRTAQGFCTENITDDLVQTFSKDYLYDSVAFRNKFDQPAEVTIYATLKPEEYKSSCGLKRRYEALTYLLEGELDNSLMFPYGNYTEDDYSKAYQKDKRFLNVDPYLATYWLLRFGIVFDDRYKEVELLAGQIEHPLVKSALSFFKEKAYQHDAGAYTGRIFNSEDDYVTVSDLLDVDGKYKMIKTGSDAFRRFHSDYIFHYYHKNHIRSKSTVNALIYSLENDRSGLSLEKAMLLVDVAKRKKLLKEIKIPESSYNQLAWTYTRLIRDEKSIGTEEKVKFISDLFQMKNSASKSRIKAIESLQVDKTLAQRFIDKIQQEEAAKDYLKKLGVKDKDNETEIKNLAKELLAGRHFDYFQQLIKKGDTKAASHLASITIDLASDIARSPEEKELKEIIKGLFSRKTPQAKINENTLLQYIDFEMEQDDSVNMFEGALNLLQKKNKNRVKDWAKKQLQQSRLHWADERSVSSISGFVEMFRRFAK